MEAKLCSVGPGCDWAPLRQWDGSWPAAGKALSGRLGEPGPSNAGRWSPGVGAGSVPSLVLGGSRLRQDQSPRRHGECPPARASTASVFRSPLDREVGPSCDPPSMRALLGTLWLALACSSVHATLSKSDAKKAASKTLQEKVGGLGTRQRADHHASFPTGGREPTAIRELRVWAASTVPLGAPAGLRGSSFWCWVPRAGLPPLGSHLCPCPQGPPHPSCCLPRPLCSPLLRRASQSSSASCGCGCASFWEGPGRQGEPSGTVYPT